MAFTENEVIQLAQSYLGKGYGTTTAVSTNLVNTAKAFFKLCYSSNLAKPNWGFATKIVELSQLVTTPIVDEYSYIYQLPADYKSLVRTFPVGVDYEIYGDNTLYTTVNELWIAYRYNPDITLAPDYFVRFLAYDIAIQLSLSGSNDPEKAAVLIKLRDQAKLDALYIDCQSHPTRSMLNGDLAQEG